MVRSALAAVGIACICSAVTEARVIRIEIPEAELSSVGLWPPMHAGAVQADVLVGQDGLARAVRLVQ